MLFSTMITIPISTTVQIKDTVKVVNPGTVKNASFATLENKWFVYIKSQVYTFQPSPSLSSVAEESAFLPHSKGHSFRWLLL